MPDARVRLELCERMMWQPAKKQLLLIRHIEIKQVTRNSSNRYTMGVWPETLRMVTDL